MALIRHFKSLGNIKIETLKFGAGCYVLCIYKTMDMVVSSQCSRVTMSGRVFNKWRLTMVIWMLFVIIVVMIAYAIDLMAQLVRGIVCTRVAFKKYRFYNYTVSTMLFYASIVVYWKRCT